MQLKNLVFRSIRGNYPRKSSFCLLLHKLRLINVDNFPKICFSIKLLSCIMFASTKENIEIINHFSKICFLIKLLSFKMFAKEMTNF